MNIDRLSGTGTVTGDGTALYERKSNVSETLSNRLKFSSLEISGNSLNLLITGDNELGYANIRGGSTVMMGHAHALGQGQVHINTGSHLDIQSFEFDLSRITNQYGSDSAGGLKSSANGVFYSDKSTEVYILNPITGSASIVQRGTGTLTLAASNSHSGGITVHSGTLQLSHANALGTGMLHVHSGAKAYTAEGFDISRVRGSGSLEGESVHAHYYYSSANDFVSDISYTLYSRFVKSGTSSLTLNGQNYVERQVQLNAGKLIVNGSLSSGQVIETTPRFTIGGRGEVSDLLLVSQSRLAPGNSVGTFTAGNTTWAGSAVYEWEITDGLGAAGVGYDTFIVDGALTLMPTVSRGGPIIIKVTSLDEFGNPGLASNFDDRLDYTFILTTAIGGIHSGGIPEFIVDTSDFQNEFDGTWAAAVNMNSIELHYTAVPEPALVALIVALGAVLAVMRKRGSGVES